MTTTITGIEIKDTIVHGNLIISGVTIQAPRELPPLWVNVPILPREFVGRDELVVGLVVRLLAGQSTALSADGLPGVGKTALAVVLAHHPALLDHFVDGVLWAGLGPQGDAMSALTAWGTALGVDVTDQPTVQQRSQAVRNAIGQRRLLLVIDDAWDLTAAEPLRCGGPGCAHLLTARDQGLARAFAGSANQVAVPELEEDPALDLLRRLAPEACAADPTAASRLARAVGGLPLALELVGGFLAEPERSFFAELSVEAWGEMSDPAQRLQLATVRLGAVDGRQVTLHDTIALSLEHLPQPAVDAFHALGAFAAKPASFDLEAAKAVTEADAASLALLAARNLLTRLDGEQLALHQVLADVARIGLPPAAIERHRDYYLALVDEDREDWQRIGAIYPQVLQAWQWQAAAADGGQRLLDFVWFLRVYQERQGLWADKLRWSQRGRDFAHEHELAADETSMLVNIGGVYSALGDQQLALACYEQALSLLRQVGDLSGEALTLNNIGAAYSALGDERQALAYYEMALPLSRQMGDRKTEALALNNIGLVNHILGDRQLALVYYEQALPLFRQVGDRSSEATTLNNIAGVYDVTSDQQPALAYYKQALALNRQVGDRGGEAATLNNIGGVYRALGDKKQALAYYEQALVLNRQVGDRRAEARALTNIGAAYHALDDKHKALAYLEQALALSREVGDRNAEARTLHNIGAAYNALNNKPKALVNFGQALPRFREVGDREGEATTLNSIGGVYDALGDKQQALAYYEQALPLYRQLGDRSGEATTLHNIGGMYSALGDKQQALRYYEQALPLMRQVGDRRGEAVTLNNIGLVCADLGDKQQALRYYEQALPLSRQVGDRSGEATTLTNIGEVYDDLGDKRQALRYYEQALPLSRQVGDRSGEAMTLNDMAAVYFQQGQPDRAVDMLRQAIDLDRAVGAVAQEAGHTYNLAYALHHALDQTAEAIQLLNHSVALLQRDNLPQDANGGTLAQHQTLLQQLQTALSTGPQRPKRSWRNLFGR